MNTCKQCGKDFVYDDEHGYAVDLCGPFCDGVNSQQAKIAALAAEVERLSNENAELSRGGVHWWHEMRKIATVLGVGKLTDVLPEVERVQRAAIAETKTLPSGKKRE